MGTDGSLRGDLSTTDVARQLHTVNSAYTLVLRGNAPPDLAAIPTFDEAPPYQRDTFLSLTKKIVGKRPITPTEVHQEWIDLMKGNGWTRGTLNEHNKTHPLLVPYADLPANEQIRAVLFIAAVQGVMTPIGQRQPTGVGAVVDGY
jgi:hypothetical protein